MKRLIEKIVFCGLVTACRLATVPTSRSPDCVNATTDGVVRPPSAFSMTVGSWPSRTAMHELVVPRSMPMVFPILPLKWRLRKKSERQYGRYMAGDKTPARAHTRLEGHMRRSTHAAHCGRWAWHVRRP